ncbi:Bax inhibitor-1/YccA family protein [Anaplasmataceae bacterium AB001_6]|nr:Bax inhibitor-1/YccA family protein [Anaplasmataceae bacterium AB001_6]
MRYNIDNRTKDSTFDNTYNEGLRKYLVSLYKHMAMALSLTGLIAFLVSSSPAILSILYGTPLHWVIMFAPIVYVYFFSSRIHFMTVSNARLAFGIFAALMGLSLSWVFIAYTSTSIARVFFITSSMFGAMALYGNTTNKDLTAIGSFMLMGLIGLIVASLVNIFAQSSALQFAISVIGVVVFSALTAYDAQKIKSMYFQYGGGDSVTLDRVVILGALRLYFDFINLFISMLHLFGERR